MPWLSHSSDAGGGICILCILRRNLNCFPHLSGTLTRGFGLSVGQRPTTAPKAYIMCLKTA